MCILNLKFKRAEEHTCAFGAYITTLVQPFVCYLFFCYGKAIIHIVSLLLCIISSESFFVYFSANSFVVVSEKSKIHQ